MSNELLGTFSMWDCMCCELFRWFHCFFWDIMYCTVNCLYPFLHIPYWGNIWAVVVLRSYKYFLLCIFLLNRILKCDQVFHCQKRASCFGNQVHTAWSLKLYLWVLQDYYWGRWNNRASAESSSRLGTKICTLDTTYTWQGTFWMVVCMGSFRGSLYWCSNWRYICQGYEACAGWWSCIKTSKLYDSLKIHSFIHSFILRFPLLSPPLLNSWLFF